MCAQHANVCSPQSSFVPLLPWHNYQRAALRTRRLQLRFLPGAPITGMWLNPNSRGSRLRIWQPWGCKSLHAHHFTATGFSGNSRPRRLKIAEPSGCKSRVADQPSLCRASARRAGVWLIGNSRPVRLKIEQPWECKSPHADQFGMSTGRASRTCLLNSGLLEKGVWCESTAFRQSFIRRWAVFRYLLWPSVRGGPSLRQTLGSPTRA